MDNSPSSFTREDLQNGHLSILWGTTQDGKKKHGAQPFTKECDLGEGGAIEQRVASMENEVVKPCRENTMNRRLPNIKPKPEQKINFGPYLNNTKYNMHIGSNKYL